MSAAIILSWSLLAAQLMLLCAMLLNTWRLVRGPRAQDRVLCLDALYANAMLMIILFGIRTGSSLYFVAALVIAVIGFVSSVALAKFLMRGE
ncbi:K+/H+ antiporter subunit F, partial [Escherichia coli]|nr:K+/H+ antiporter subunit F [Escherichia coli]